MLRRKNASPDPEDRPAFRTAILALVEAGAYPSALWAGRRPARG